MSAVSTFQHDEFAQWLEGRGAQIQAPTNEWEVLRYRQGNRTSIVYRNKKGALTWTGESYEQYRQFKRDDVPGVAPMSAERRKRARTRLLGRDGPTCWYCGEFFGNGPKDFPTIEHLVPRSEGGGHALANLVLAHKSCNGDADNAPLARKIELRAGILARRETSPPWESVRAA